MLSAQLNADCIRVTLLCLNNTAQGVEQICIDVWCSLGTQLNMTLIICFFSLDSDCGL